MATYKRQMLDNPIWHALNTRQKDFSIGDDFVKRYQPDVLPFMGFENTFVDPLHTTKQLLASEDALVLGTLPAMPDHITVVSELPCVQMVSEMLSDVENKYQHTICKMTSADAGEMYELVNFVQPGFFRKNTGSLGDYYGIRNEGKLIAIAGQRFKIPGYTELSAICTHPEHTGKGLAQLLISFLCHKVVESGDTPFLHIAKANERAIRLYEFLGFKKRTDIMCCRLALRS